MTVDGFDGSRIERIEVTPVAYIISPPNPEKLIEVMIVDKESDWGEPEQQGKGNPIVVLVF